MENLKYLLTGREINTYQRSLALSEFGILRSKADEFDKIKAKIEGYYKHNNQFFGPALLEIVGNDIVKMFGFETYDS
jgi:hypothetical protein